MNRHDRPNAPSKSRFDQFGVYVVSVGVAIDQYGLCPDGTHGQCTRDKGINRDNDLVAFANSECLKRKPQRVKPTADGNAVRDPNKPSKRYFKLLNF